MSDERKAPEVIEIEPRPVKDKLSEAEDVAIELAMLPRTLAIDAIRRIGESLPKRAPFKRYADAAEDTVIDAFTRERAMPPPRDGGKR